jgi:chemotaxis protein methyltransferase CheR
MPEISIVETKDVIRAIRQKYNFDFTNYALTSLRYMLDKVISEHHLKYPDILINRILEDPEFFDEFLFDISIPATEIFRDPEMWQILKEECLPILYGIFNNIVIWLPDLNDSHELISLVMLLKESDFLRRSTIYASSLSLQNITEIKKGVFNNRTLELGIENYKKLNLTMPIDYFWKENKGKYIFQESLFKDVIFFKQNLQLEPVPDQINLIIFRNKLLYYSIDYQNNIIQHLTNSLQPGGMIVFGHKENPDDFINQHNELKALNTFERIYKKKNKAPLI